MPRTSPRALVAYAVAAITILLAAPGRAGNAMVGRPDGRGEPHALPAKLRTNRQYVYRIENLPTHRPVGATGADVYASIDRSFRQWEAFTAGPLGITFRAAAPGSQERADITIKFGVLPGSAGDDASSGFDCTRQCRDGDPSHIWLNDARTWTPTGLGGDGRGALELLVLHELGHLFGLPHFNAEKCEKIAPQQAQGDADCLGARAVMTRFLAVTLPGPFVMPIRCTDLAGLERVYHVSMQSSACADHLVAAPDLLRRAGATAYVAALPRVLVVDASGRPVRNVVVAFTVAGGEATGLIQVTDSSGVATLGSWIVAEGQSASAVAIVPGLGSSVRFAAPVRDHTVATNTP